MIQITLGGGGGGVSSLSCIYKLFTSVLNSRLIKVCDYYGLISDAQFAFRHGVSSSDAIFPLHATIANTTLAGKERLHCCFVDFRKAFDYVDRLSIWYKLLKLGVTDTFVSVILSIYSILNHVSLLTVNARICLPFVWGLMQGNLFIPFKFSLLLMVL